MHGDMKLKITAKDYVGENLKSRTHYSWGDFFCVKGKLENKRRV